MSVSNHVCRKKDSGSLPGHFQLLVVTFRLNWSFSELFRNINIVVGGSWMMLCPLFQRSKIVGGCCCS